MNKTVLLLIQKSLGLDEKAVKKRNLSDLACKWDGAELNVFC
jgi:hypothetical protein